MGLFSNRSKINQGNKTKTAVPVWFMRQAGRYHSHYQNIKKNSTFMEMCKNPDLATEVTMGPIRDFNFDAAILFSDLLFPLERMGMGLSYDSGPPTLQFHIDSMAQLQKIKLDHDAPAFYQFQGKAIKKIRHTLDTSKDLLGFTGAPYTLYAYASEGSHSGNLLTAKQGLFNGLFEKFSEILESEIVAQLSVQAENGADGLCLFDTAAGELTFDDYVTYALPPLRRICQKLKAKFPSVKIIYYSKFTHLHYLKAIECEHIDVLGVDWRLDMTEVLNELGGLYTIQGNLDPAYLFLPWTVLEGKLNRLFEKVKDSKHGPGKWIMGLGHGVLPKAPEENVRNAVKHVQNNFLY